MKIPVLIYVYIYIHMYIYIYLFIYLFIRLIIPFNTPIYMKTLVGYQIKKIYLLSCLLFKIV